MPICAALIGAAAHAATWQITLIEQADNPDLHRTRLERAYLGHSGGSAADAINLAVDDAQFELEPGKHSVKLSSTQAGSLDAARGSAQAAEKTGAQALMLNLPAPWIPAVASSVKIPVFNLGSASDRLRGPECAANLYHPLPSERMRADALAQALLARKWQQVLVLNGPSPLDAERTAVALASLKRFGLKVAAQKPFKLSTDPRERNLANVLLLTAGASYDVVWVVDSDGEFARSLPYNTQLPRPVVGDGGLVALAWHGQFDRFGAPQVSRRFAKAAKRPMTDTDWAAWMAAKAVVSALVSSSAMAPKPDAAFLAKTLLATELDGAKGLTMQFRPWDRQLRQPLLLTDGQGVLGILPLDGMLHPRNVLDTLGADEAENLCKTR